MKETRKIKCRYGVEYTHTFEGSRGANARTFQLMEKCCCWVCHNRECKNPKNEILDDCHYVCELWAETGKHYCGKKQEKK